MSYRLPETWTQDEEDELIYLYENHTHGFIISLVRALTANRWHKKSPLQKQCAYQKNIITL